MCPHGVSGKSNGGCKNAHRKRCVKFMKWGNRSSKGCSDAKCEFLHPLLCGKSLELKCLDKACPYRLHTQKCQRLPTSASGGQPGRGTASQGQGQHGNNKFQSRYFRNGAGINPWQNNNIPSSSAARFGSAALPGSAAQPGSAIQSGRGAQSEQQPEQSFQDLTVQPKLEAYMSKLRQEMREEVKVLSSFMIREIHLAQQGGLRHSF